MSIPGRATAAVKRLAMWACLGVLVFAFVVAGLGFLVSAFYIWVEQYKSHWVATAITGGALFGVAIIFALIGSLILKKMKKRQPSMLSEFTGMAGVAGRIAGMLIRRDPRKSLILAIIAGAVAEYVTSDSKKRN